ncbi:MAG TPA: YjcZ family sporulation protein [Ureibacillus sp.]|nr:YjcZ family sporulation protein [Ureibacillus sp.]
MWNHNFCGCNQVSPAYDMGNDYCDHGKNNSTFVLIVVLFILLIIVGSVVCW